MTDATPQDKALQKKLVGAAVLIAIAVIFLPMLFDGKQDDRPVSQQIEIPPKPVYDIPNRLAQGAVAETGGSEAETQAPPVRTIPIAPPVEPEPLPDNGAAQQPSAPAVVDKPIESTEAKPTKKPQSVEKPKPARAEKPTPKKVEKPRPAKAPRPAASGGAGYVVQVGSFSQKANAETLTAKLKAKGFPAFVEGTKAGGKSIYRVKVGPRPTREAADGLRQRLIDKARLEGIIVRHH